MSSRELPRIDYRQHPAFAALTPGAHGEEVDALLDRIDSELDAAVAQSTPASALRRFQGELDPLFDRVAEASRALVPEGFARERALAAVAETRRVLQGQVVYRIQQRLYAGDHEFRRSERLADELRARGLAVTTLPRKSIDRVKEAIEPAYARLRHEAAQDPRGRRALSLSTDRASFAALMKSLDADGVVGAIRDYERCPVVPLYMSLAHSVSAETWWRDCYRDAGLATARTAYLHNDEDYDIVKLIIYLHEVGPRNGPFSFIPGSHLWRRSLVRSRLAKQVDRSFVEALKASPPPAGGEAYYRQHFIRPEMRREFLSLPAAFRASSHFGDDILDDSSLSRELLALEERVTSDRGNCMIFCGRDGVHRGALVEDGERWALQLGFARADRAPVALLPGLRRSILRRVRALLGDGPVDRFGRTLRRR